VKSGEIVWNVGDAEGRFFKSEQGVLIEGVAAGRESDFVLRASHVAG
jgi:hypothetical protein